VVDRVDCQGVCQEACKGLTFQGCLGSKPFLSLTLEANFMLEAKNTQRALVRIGYDGRVHKQFLGPNAKERFENECRVLKHLEVRGCSFVPRLLGSDPQTLEIVTSNCGARVEHMSEERIKERFAELESFGVRHDDAFLRNITYRSSDGRFCIIDFEFSTILDDAKLAQGSELNGSDFNGGDLQATESAMESGVKIRWSACSDPGTFRSNNEDRFLGVISSRYGIRYLGKIGTASTADGDTVFAVADGMGGERSGELAGKIATDELTRMLPKAQALNHRILAETYPQILKDLFQSIHRELDRIGFDVHCKNMGSTFTVVWIHGRLVMYAHIGDTRLYRLVRAEGESTYPLKMTQISEDHTFVGWLRRTGQINERQARFHPRKNVLSRALGASHQFVEPQIGSFTLSPGERLLLCTDGVIEGLWDHAIRDLVCDTTSLDDPISPAERLVRTAVSESGRDNSTAIIVELLD
jgi:serine/threonine protein phosphatase PrpC